MSLLRDMKFLSHDKSIDLTSLNVCDIIISVYDKFIWCDVTSLIYFLNPITIIFYPLDNFNYIHSIYTPYQTLSIKNQLSCFC